MVPSKFSLVKHHKSLLVRRSNLYKVKLKTFSTMINGIEMAIRCF